MTSAAQARRSAFALAAEVVALARAAGTTLAVAESLTAGLVSSTLASIPGASQVLRGGVVAYATDVKGSLLGVDATLLAGGAVQPEVAAAMAIGVADRLAADLSVATTGVAGPDPQDGRPPGTVYVAIHRRGARSPGRVESRSGDGALPGDRDEVRWESVVLALDLLAQELRKKPGAVAR